MKDKDKNSTKDGEGGTHLQLIWKKDQVKCWFNEMIAEAYASMIFDFHVKKATTQCHNP